MQERWNDNMKVVIVGGVAGGATAAARIRRLNEQAEIVVFERSGYISYANCGLPYYIGDVITDRSDLTLQTPESFFSRFHVNMKVRHEVTAIHPEKKSAYILLNRDVDTPDISIYNIIRLIIYIIYNGSFITDCIKIDFVIYFFPFIFYMNYRIRFITKVVEKTYWFTP